MIGRNLCRGINRRRRTCQQVASLIRIIIIFIIIINIAIIIIITIVNISINIAIISTSFRHPDQLTGGRLVGVMVNQ